MTRKLTNVFGKVFQTIELDTENKWVQIVSEGYLSDADVKAGALALTETMIETGFSCVLNDMRLVVGPISASEWAAVVWPPEVAKAGLRYMALLSTADAMAVTGISKFHIKQTYFLTEVFDDVHAAKVWLQQRCN